jgi:hypothetical protein
MKNKILILMIMILVAMPSFAAELVNFRLDNRRCDGTDYLVDLVADIDAGQVWTVGVMTLVLEYNPDAIDASAYDGTYLSDLNALFSGTDYAIYQTKYSSDSNQVAISIYTTTPAVDLAGDDNKIGTFKFAVVDTTKYDQFKWVNDYCSVYNSTEKITIGSGIANFGLTAPWSRRIKPLIGTPTLTTPTDGDTDVAFDVVLDWGDVATATAYKLRVATNDAFTSGIVLEKELATSTYTADNTELSEGTTYYWQAAALNSTDTSFWANAYEFTTQAALDAPTLTSPSNSSTDVAIDVTLDWSDVADADNYYLQVSESATFATTHIDDNTLTVSSFDCSSNNLSYGKTYYWRVKSLKTGGQESVWSSTFVFQTKTLDNPTLVTPADGATSQDVTGVSLVWNSVDEAATYTVKVADDNAFGAGDIVYTTTGADTNATTSALTLGTTYYWRVYSTAASGQTSDESTATIRSFTTETIAAPVLATPTDTECGVATEPTFTWNSVSNADSYELQVSEYSNFSSTVYTYAGTALTTTVPGGSALDEGTEYYWRVRGIIGGTYNGTWASAFSFSTTSTLTLVSPADAATSVSRHDPQFKWNDVSVATKYNIQISTTATFDAGTIEYDAEPVDSNYTADYLNKNTTYYWRVRAYVCSAWGSFTTARSLTTEGFNGPTLYLPVNSATDVSVAPTMTWQLVTEADHYDIVVSDQSDFSTTVWSDTSDANNEDVTGLDYHTKYYWRVRTVNVNEASDWSTTFSFDAENAPCDWSPTVTSYVHEITIPTTVDPTIYGRDIDYDDYVGVFYDSSGTAVCAGVKQWTGLTMRINVYGDDPGTPEKEGFSDGETLNFYIWDSYEARSLLATAVIGTGLSTFSDGTTSTLDSLYVGSGSAYHDFSLPKGWSMISSYVKPDETRIDSIFASTPNLFLLKNGRGKIYLPAYGIDQVNNWDYTQGYLLYTTATDNLQIAGTEAIPEDETLYIAKGWNMISYLCTKSGAIDVVLDSIYSNLFLAKNGRGKITLPTYGIDQIVTMNPGEGYLLYMTAADTLIYPPNSTLKPVAVEPVPEAKYLTVKPNALSNANLILDTGLSDETEIGVYNESGELVGSGIVMSGRAVVSVFGINEYDANFKGAGENELLKLRAFNPNAKQYLDLEVQDIKSLLGSQKSDLRFESNSVLSAKVNAIIETETLQVISVNPNPTADEFEITVDNGGTDIEEAKIAIFDNTGKELETIFKGDIGEDFVHKFNCRNLTSGTYTVVLTYDGKREIAKVIIEK